MITIIKINDIIIAVMTVKTESNIQCYLINVSDNNSIFDYSVLELDEKKFHEKFRQSGLEINSEKELNEFDLENSTIERIKKLLFYKD